MEWFEVQRGQLFHECHPRKSHRADRNHFGGSGRPDYPRQTVFFFDSEWVRIALPISQRTVPTRHFKITSCTTPFGWNRFRTGSVYQAVPQSVPFYRKMFSLYGNTNGTPLTVLGCPFDVVELLPQLRMMGTVAQSSEHFAFKR